MKKTLLLLLLLLVSCGFASSRPIPVNSAFQLSATIQAKQLILQWKIAPHYLLYRERIDVETKAPTDIKLGAYQLPKGIVHQDPIMGQYQVYKQHLRLSIPIKNYQAAEFGVWVKYQGCSSTGYCYPPQRKLLTIQLSAFGAQVQSIENVKYNPRVELTKPNRPQHSLLFSLLTFFALGLLLAFTPCVLPMLPILSGIILGKARSTKHAFLLSLTYVLAMACAYTIAGLIAGMFGSYLQAALQAPWVIVLFALLFVLLALSLFGLYELRLPHRWQTNITLASEKQKRGSYIGVAVMGALSILIVSPCISAPLVAALAFISQSGQTARGGLLLFTMALGMGLPLLLVGTLGGKYLPKAGPWMHTIKHIIGVLLLLTAVWLLYRLIPGQICLLLWGLIAIISAIYLGAFKFKRISLKSIFWYFILWAWLLLGLVFFIGGISGNQDPLHPLDSVKQEHSLAFIKIKTVNDLQQALNKAHGKVVMLDFYAKWCVSCKIIQRNIFQQKEVQTLLRHVVLLQADITANDDEDNALQTYLNVYAPPTIIFFDKNGHEIKQARLVGEVSRQTFIDNLADV